MPTLAPRIDELAPRLIAAQEETRQIIERSRAKRASVLDLWRIVYKTLTTRSRLCAYTKEVGILIDVLTTTNLTLVGDETLTGWASAIDRLVVKQRGFLGEAETLGSEIRIFWQKYLLKISEQAEHLDSIAESLRLECDREASLLLAVAAGGVSEPGFIHRAAH